jgi:hypothetical protein
MAYIYPLQLPIDMYRAASDEIIALDFEGGDYLDSSEIEDQLGVKSGMASAAAFLLEKTGGDLKLFEAHANPGENHNYCFSYFHEDKGNMKGPKQRRLAYGISPSLGYVAGTVVVNHATAERIGTINYKTVNKVCILKRGRTVPNVDYADISMTQAPNTYGSLLSPHDFHTPPLLPHDGTRAVIAIEL